jgi:hypothetical protein
MPPYVAHYLNKDVLVSIPSLFGDIKARSCRVVAAEAFGVWLKSSDLSARLLPAPPDPGAVPPGIFVPFAEIGAIVPIVPAPSATAGLKPASAASAELPKTAAGRTGNVRTNPPSPKASGSAGA